MTEQRGGDLHPLLVAQGQRLELVLGPVREPKAVEQVHDEALRRRRRHTVQSGEVDELVGHLLLGVEPRSSGMYPNWARSAAVATRPSHWTEPPWAASTP